MRWPDKSEFYVPDGFLSSRDETQSEARQALLGGGIAVSSGDALYFSLNFHKPISS
jgi:hypothetical protein